MAAQALQSIDLSGGLEPMASSFDAAGHLGWVSLQNGTLVGPLPRVRH
jgi:hypothetical protein